MVGTQTWLAVTLCLARVFTLLPNAIGAASLNFRVVTRLQQVQVLGETVVAPVGQVNPWIAFGQATVLGALVYILHASLQTWRAGQRQKALLAGGSFVVFVVLGLTQTIRLAWFGATTPPTVGLYFLVVVLAMGYQLGSGILQAEALVVELKAQNSLTDALFEGIPGLLGLYADDGRPLRWNRNQEELTGFSGQEIARINAQEWYQGIGQDLTSRQWRQMATEGRGVFETRLRTRKGEPLTVLVSFARLDLKGVAHFLAIGIDITSQRRMELELGAQRQQLAHLGRVSAMGLLSASIAHELNQPLTAILSNAQAGIRFLAGPTPDLEELKEILKDIAEEDARAGKVIRGMRSLLKNEAATLERVDLASVFEDTVLMVRGESVIRNIPIRLDLAQDLPRVRGDRVQFQQVALNLVVNAMEAMDSARNGDRAIDIKADWTGAGDLRFRVIDQGTGIPGEELERIFEPFHTTKRRGMGIGLPVCRFILESCGGRIWAENNQGPGSTFTVSFRLACA